MWALIYVPQPDLSATRYTDPLHSKPKGPETSSQSVLLSRAQTPSAARPKENLSQLNSKLAQSHAPDVKHNSEFTIQVPGLPSSSEQHVARHEYYQYLHRYYIVIY